MHNFCHQLIKQPFGCHSVLTGGALCRCLDLLQPVMDTNGKTPLPLDSIGNIICMQVALLEQRLKSFTGLFDLTILIH